MSSAPSTPTTQDIDAEDEPSWTDFLLPLGLFAIAVIPFTPYWEQIADPDSTSRKYGAISRFLDSVGPVPVALTFGGLGLILLIAAIAQRSRRNDSTVPDSAED